jgi:peptidyl-prolyl cis-trans isomerase B (cyclophilin B)
MNKLMIIFCLLYLNMSLAANPKVRMETTYGTIDIELLETKAPLTVANFLKYVDAKFYDKTIFHRVIKTFMIQGGGFTKDVVKKANKRAPIKNEADNGLLNVTGTIAMARTNDPHSASSQFFINVEDNASLDFKGKNSSGWGYAVFGKVIKGMNVVNRIKNIRTGKMGGLRDVPMDTIEITSVRRI